MAIAGFTCAMFSEIDEFILCVRNYIIGKKEAITLSKRIKAIRLLIALCNDTGRFHSCKLIVLC
jgi:hypothetical protein